MISDKEGLEWLEKKLKALKRRTILFDLLKHELNIKGYWKNKPRGNGGNIANLTNKATINTPKHTYKYD